MWSPLTPEGEAMYDANGDICCAEDLVPDVADPQDLLGKSWCYKLEIFGISKLPVVAAKCYCQYTFDGQTFTTEVIDQHTDHPRWDYTCVHRVDEVNQEFIDRLQTNSMNIHVFVSPYIAQPPQDKISTQNPVVAKNMGFNVGADLQTENELLREKVALLEKENSNLKEHLKKLSNGPASAIGQAQAKDAAINK
jgi:hypothetical protein